MYIDIIQISKDNIVFELVLLRWKRTMRRTIIFIFTASD